MFNEKAVTAWIKKSAQNTLISYTTPTDLVIISGTCVLNIPLNIAWKFLPIQSMTMYAQYKVQISNGGIQVTEQPESLLDIEILLRGKTLHTQHTYLRTFERINRKQAAVIIYQCGEQYFGIVEEHANTLCSDCRFQFRVTDAVPVFCGYVGDEWRIIVTPVTISDETKSFLK